MGLLGIGWVACWASIRSHKPLEHEPPTYIFGYAVSGKVTSPSVESQVRYKNQLNQAKKTASAEA
jgi:hypothetical protein